MDDLKDILQELIVLETDAMELFIAKNPECFDKSKPDWLYPRLLTFFSETPHDKKVDEILLRLGKFLSEQVNDNSFSELSAVDKSLSLDDSYVEKFILLINQNASKDYKFQEINSPYKTKRYSIALQEIDKWTLQNLTMEFGETEHPYILSEIANCYFMSSKFLEAFNYLYRAAKQLTTYPNKYWNSEYGMIGATNLFRHLLTLSTEIEHKRKLFKLYYLHLTRLICITKDKLILSNSYSNRAFLCRERLAVYFMPSIGINPDLLYMSDLWYAHHSGQPEVPAAMTMDFFKMSTTMYQNASLYVNDTGGYKDIEDRTYSELVTVKHIQSFDIATTYLQEFKEGICNINRQELNKLFHTIENECRYDYDNFKKRVLNFKK